MLERLEITDEDIEESFRSLNATLLFKVKSIEFNIKYIKGLLVTDDFGRWAAKLGPLKAELQVYQVIRLYIKHKGKNPISEYSNFVLNKAWANSSRWNRADIYLEWYSRLCFLESLEPFDLGRKLPRLVSCSKADRWNKNEQLKSWPYNNGYKSDLSWKMFAKETKEAFLADFREWRSK